MKLLFQNVSGNERVIAEVNNEEEAFKKIKEFCDERDFRCYYTRSWQKDGRTIVDVGSHFEFFILEYDASN